MISRIAIGLAVRTLRSNAAITARELARRAGIEQTALSRVERGVRVLDFTEAMAICDILDVSIVDLIRISKALDAHGVTAARGEQQKIGEQIRRIVAHAASKVSSGGTA